MKREQPAHGPVSGYLNWLRSEDPASAEGLEADIAICFGTDEGLRVLKMLEKAVLHAAQPLGAPDGALRELNAQRNLVLEIRRYVAHGR